MRQRGIEIAADSRDVAEAAPRLDFCPT